MLRVVGLVLAMPSAVMAVAVQAATVRPEASAQQNHATAKLFNAIESNDMQGFFSAIKEGANVNANNDDGRTPLMCCVRKNQPDMASELVHHSNIDDLNVTDVWGGTVLFYVVRRYMHDGFYGLAELLIKKGADVKVLSGRRRTLIQMLVRLIERDRKTVLNQKGDLG